MAKLPETAIPDQAATRPRRWSNQRIIMVRDTRVSTPWPKNRMPRNPRVTRTNPEIQEAASSPNSPATAPAKTSIRVKYRRNRARNTTAPAPEVRAPRRSYRRPARVISRELVKVPTM